MEFLRRNRLTLILAGIGLAILAVAITRIAAAGRRDTAHPAPTLTVVAPAVSWTPSIPAVPDDVRIAWAYLDSTEGDQWFGGDVDQHPLDQLVIPGLAADYLNTIDQRGATPSPHDVATVRAALTGDPAAAGQLADDPDTAFDRVIDACGLTDTTPRLARASATDLARYAACLREGAIADPATSVWVLDQMRETPAGIGEVRGNTGGQHLAQFNSIADDGHGRIRTGCMAAGAYWSAGVFVDAPADRGRMYGIATCARIARVQFPPDTQQAPDSSPTPAFPSSACPHETCRGTD